MPAHGAESIQKQFGVSVRFSSNIPNWLDMLLRKKFFDRCLDHHKLKKKEKNIFCLDCCTSFCSNCSQNHFGHRTLQIRKYNCHEVVKKEEMDKLINCSLVQPYNLNRAHVVFLRAHPLKKKESAEEERCDNQVQLCKKKKGKADNSEDSNGICFCTCSIREAYKYCSITCKVQQLLKTEGSIVRHLRHSSLLPIPLNRDELDEEQPFTDHFPGAPTSANSSSSLGNGSASVGLLKRRNECEASSFLLSAHKRKGVPRRSPLF